MPVPVSRSWITRLLDALAAGALMAVFCISVMSFFVGMLVGLIASFWRDERLTWLALLIPLAGLAGGAWAMMGAWRISTDAVRQADGQCLDCGYDLRASTGRCPECGRAM